MTCSCDKECDCNKPKAHPHAELMAQYAEDAKKTDRPWELWEYYFRGDGGGTWYTCNNHPSWLFGSRYRRKPQKKIHKVYLALCTNGASYLFQSIQNAGTHTKADIREITWEVEV